VLPPLCPLNVSAADFSHADELITRSKRATGSWLDEGGPDLPMPQRFVSLQGLDPDRTVEVEKPKSVRAKPRGSHVRPTERGIRRRA